MKTLAGYVLNLRKPSTAPANARLKAVEDPGKPTPDSKAMAQKHKNVVPPAKPSRPSARFTALVTPTRNRTVIGQDNQAGNDRRSSKAIDSMRASPATMTMATAAS